MHPWRAILRRASMHGRRSTRRRGSSPSLALFLPARGARSTCERGRRASGSSIVASPALRLPRYALLCARSRSFDDVAGWLEIALFVAVLTALTPLLGGYMARVFTASALLTAPRRRRARPSTGCSASTAERGAGLAGATRAPSSSSARLVRLAALPDPAHAGRCTRSTRRTSLGRPGTSRSTPPRRSSRTRTGSSTAARRRCRYFSQMAGLAVQNFVSAAVGIAVRRGLHPRARARSRRRSSATSGVDLTRVLLYVLLPLSVIARCPRLPGRAADARRYAT